MQRLIGRLSISAVLGGCGSSRATTAASSHTSILINPSSAGNVERSNKVRWASWLCRLDKRRLYRHGLLRKPELDIHIKTDTDNGVITITDSLVGMTRETLVYSLPIITSKLLKGRQVEFKDGGDRTRNLIGSSKLQERVEKIELSTKSPDSGKQYVWEGDVNYCSYAIHEETDPSRLIPRGTRLKFYLKRDDKGFEIALKELASTNHLTRAGLPLKLLDWLLLKDAKQDARTSFQEASLLLRDIYYRQSASNSLDAQLKIRQKMKDLWKLKNELRKRERAHKERIRSNVEDHEAS